MSWVTAIKTAAWQPFIRKLRATATMLLVILDLRLIWSELGRSVHRSAGHQSVPQDAQGSTPKAVTWNVSSHIARLRQMRQ